MIRTTQSRTRLLCIGASLGVIALALSAGAASAQDTGADGQEVSEVVVTGFRNSLEKALDLKRESAGSTDSILAEDIGKFPDLNLSESIQRIPGVALARDAGEGRQVSVRGLGPQFTRVRIDGMEALTTAGGTDAAGGTNRSRSFDFNVFASDLFNSITVRKTASAETEEGSLGATVDLRTARPFDYGGFKLAASAQASFNDLSEESSPRAAFMISNTWLDGKVGALVSVAYSKRKLLDEGASTVRWAKGSAFAPGFDACNPTLPQTVLTCGPNATNPTTANTINAQTVAYNAAFHPRIPRYDIYNQETERLGVTLALQYAPTDRTNFTLDVLYADFKGTREEQFIEVPSFSTGGATGIGDTNIVSGTIDSHNTLIKGVFDDVDLRVEDRFDELQTTFTQFTLSGDHQFTDAFKGRFLVGHSKSDHNNPVQTTLLFDQNNIDGYSYDYSQGRTPVIGYGNANLTSPAAWTLTQIRERPQTSKNSYDTLSLGGDWAQSELFTFKGGLDYKRYTFSSTELRRSNGSATNQEAVIPAAIAAIPISGYSRLLTFNGVSTLVPDLARAASLLSLYDQTIYGGAFHLGPEPALGNNNGVNEKDVGGFFQGDFNTAVFGMPLRGNFGVRVVQTEQSSRGYTFSGGVAVPIEVERGYSDTLPSINVVLEPIPDFLVRVGVAKTMSRPNLGNLTPGATVSVSGNTRSVTIGNPYLNPFRANAYDVAFEWYFQKGALVSVALFRKDIASFVQTVVTNAPFTGNPYNLPDSIAIAACGIVVGCNPAAQWAFSKPSNTSGGTVEGFEINYQQPFTFLPGPLSHTGFLGNYTYVTSEQDYVNSSGVVIATNDITGLSRRGYNATLYYEDDRFSARVSASYRSKYLTRVPGAETGTDVDGTNETFNVDASFQYTFNENLKFTLEGVNLTDEYQDQYNDSSDRISFYHHTGREFLLGVRYTY